MGYIHSVFLIMSALAYSLLLFDLGASSGTVLQAIRTSLILVVPILLGSLVLHGRPKVQSKVLMAVQIIAVILSAVYYYLLWGAGLLTGMDGETALFRQSVRSFAPILGYVFLSLAVRILARKLKILSQMGRLRD